VSLCEWREDESAKIENVEDMRRMERGNFTEKVHHDIEDRDFHENGERRATRIEKLSYETKNILIC
jgi:hypothetical protein